MREIQIKEKDEKRLMPSYVKYRKDDETDSYVVKESRVNEFLLTDYKKKY